MTTIDKLPLAMLFYQLKKHGLQLGVDDYELVLRAIQSGYCGENLQDIKKLCTTLWVKTEHDAHVLDSLFHDSIKLSSPDEVNSPKAGLDREANLPSESVADHDEKWQGQTTESSDRLTDESAALKHFEDVWTMSKIGIIDENLTNSSFIFANNYFPVTRRQMKQAWRHLRRMVRVGPPIDLNVQLTIEKVARQGVLHELVLLPRRVNKAKLILFIDQDGSMAPFKPLIRQLIDTATSEKGTLARVEFYYFHDYPDEYLYSDAARLKARLLHELFSSFDKSTPVLIISDAGAARGSYDEYRIARTEKFIEMLCAHINKFAWLNPMPRDRWKDSSAEKISEQIHMFEMSRHGLEMAIKILRGQNFLQPQDKS